MIRFRRKRAAKCSDPAVPFRLIAGRIVIEAVLDGRPVIAIVDTGVPVSLVRPGLPPLPGTEFGRTAIFQSEHGPVKANLVGPARFSIGGLTLTLRDLIVMPDSFLAETGIDADVVVGQDVLSATAFEIDFEHHIIRSRAKGWRPEPSFAVVPFSLDDSRRLVIPSDLPGAGRVSAIVDLGSNAALTMDAKFAQRHHLFDYTTASSGLFATLGGVSETIAFSLPAFTIGGLPVVDVPVDALPCWSSPQPINIGIEVLRRFHLALNFASAELALRPIPGVAFEREMSGVLIAHRGPYLEVVHVARQSPADTAGIQRGDHITAIDGVRVDANYFKGNLWRWRYGPTGKSVRLGIQRKEHSIQLSRYY